MAAVSKKEVGRLERVRLMRGWNSIVNCFVTGMKPLVVDVVVMEMVQLTLASIDQMLADFASASPKFQVIEEGKRILELAFGQEPFTVAKVAVTVSPVCVGFPLNSLRLMERAF